MKTARTTGVKSEALREPAWFMETLQEFGAELLCIQHLEKVRWPDGLRCIREGCDSERIMSFATKGKTGKSRYLYECVDCRYQYSVTTGTMFHNSHIPLSKWFLAIHMFCSANKAISAKELERRLKVNYRTAGYVIRRIRLAIQQENE
jgi:transposase-like protein